MDAAFKRLVLAFFILIASLVLILADETCQVRGTEVKCSGDKPNCCLKDKENFCCNRTNKIWTLILIGAGIGVAVIILMVIIWYFCCRSPGAETPASDDVEKSTTGLSSDKPHSKTRSKSFDEGGSDEKSVASLGRYGGFFNKDEEEDPEDDDERGKSREDIEDNPHVKTTTQDEIKKVLEDDSSKVEPVTLFMRPPETEEEQQKAKELSKSRRGSKGNLVKHTSQEDAKRSEWPEFHRSSRGAFEGRKSVEEPKDRETHKSHRPSRGTSEGRKNVEEPKDRETHKSHRSSRGTFQGRRSVEEPKGGQTPKSHRSSRGTFEEKRSDEEPKRGETSKSHRPSRGTFEEKKSHEEPKGREKSASLRSGNRVETPHKESSSESLRSAVPKGRFNWFVDIDEKEKSGRQPKRPSSESLSPSRPKSSRIPVRVESSDSSSNRSVPLKSHSDLDVTRSEGKPSTNASGNSFPSVFSGSERGSDRPSTFSGAEGTRPDSGPLNALFGAGAPTTDSSSDGQTPVDNNARRHSRRSRGRRGRKEQHHY